MPSAVVPTHVSLKKKLVSQPTMLSRKLATPLKMTKKTLGCGTLRSLLSQFWKLSRSWESDSHVSPLGHGDRVLPAEVRDEHPDDDGDDEAGPSAPPGPRGGDREPRGGLRGGHQSRSPAIAMRTDSRSTTPTTRSPSQRTDRALARGDHRHRVAHGRLHVEARAVRLARPRVAHDPAQRQHVAARDVAREVGDVLVRRRADEILRRAELDDGAVAHDRDPVAEPQRLRQVVRDEDHRLARLVLEPDHLVLHVAADERVERAERLVVEHHLRVDGERAREADALLHAAGELVGELVRAVLEADELQHLLGALVPLRLGDALDLEAEGDVVDHAPVREQAEVLEDHRRRVAPQLRAAPPPTPRARPGRRSRSRPRSARSSRMSVRTSVDLPEPDRPMTTKISPGHTSKETSRTAATQSCFARSSARGRSASRRADDAVGMAPEDLPDALGADQRLPRANGQKRPTVFPSASMSTLCAAGVFP